MVTLPVANRQIDNGSEPVIFDAGDYPVCHDASLQNCQWEIMPVGSYPQPGSGNIPTMAPSADAIKVRVHAMEEKGSDVNLVCHIHNSHLKAAQFPESLPGTAIVKPANW